MAPKSVTPDASAAGDTFEFRRGKRERLQRYARALFGGKWAGDGSVGRSLLDDFSSQMYALGSGTGWMVVDLWDYVYEGGEYGDYVVKFATPHSQEGWGGRAQNRHERRLWERLADQPDKRSYLAPVLDTDPGGYWILMPRGERNVKGTPGFRDWKRDAEYHLRDVAIWDDDIRAGNVVRIDGEFKLCDYGVPPRYSKQTVR